VAAVAAQWDYLDAEPDPLGAIAAKKKHVAAMNSKTYEHLTAKHHVLMEEGAFARAKRGKDEADAKKRAAASVVAAAAKEERSSRVIRRSSYASGVVSSTKPKGHKVATTVVQPGRHEHQVLATATHGFGGKKRRKESLVLLTAFSADDIGKVVSVIGYDGRGTIRFVGPHHESVEGVDDLRIGVEMDHPVTKGRDGIFKGVKGTAHRYFTCRKGTALLLIPANVLCVTEHTQQVGHVDVAQKAEEIFHMFDVDKNKKLAEDELTQMLHCMHKSHTRAADLFGDEHVGSNEKEVFQDFNHEELAELLFLEVDANGDGHISRKEFLLSCKEAGALHDLVKHAVISELIRVRFE
jgi:hypothetical protein